MNLNCTIKIEQTDRPTHNLQIYKCGQNIWENGVRWERHALRKACAEKGVRREGRALRKACDEKAVRWERRAMKGRALGRTCAGKGVYWEGRALKKGVRANIASLVFCPQIFLNEITRHLGRIEDDFNSQKYKVWSEILTLRQFHQWKKNPKRICRSVKLIWCLKNWSCNFSSPELMARAWETPTWRYWNLKKKSFCYKKSFLDFLFYLHLLSHQENYQKKKNMIFFIHTVLFSCFSVIFEWIYYQVHDYFLARQMFAFLK